MLNSNAHLGLEPPYRKQRRHPLALRVAGSNFHGRTRDFSASGARLQAKGPIETGRTVPLKIDFEGFQRPLELSARVRWSQSHPPFECGVEFQDLKPGQIRDIGQLLEASTRVAGEQARWVSQTSEIAAALTDWQQNQNFLTLQFENHERRVQMRFFQPRIIRSVPRLDWKPVRYVQSLQLGDDFYRIRFLENSNKVVLDLVSGAPNMEILTFAT